MTHPDINAVLSGASRWCVVEGDCLDAMRSLPPASVACVVTDPPYGLAFMGKRWDYDVPSQEIWAECLRVLKPGGHLLAFAGTRTQHRMAVRIEDAGFEIRDMIAWVYGSGFPKSLAVDKAIEKRRDDVPEVRIVCRYLRAAIDAHPELTVRSIAGLFGFHPRMVEHWAARDTDSQPTLPTPDQWTRLREVLAPHLGPDVDDLVAALNARKGEFGEDWHARDVTGLHKPDQTPAATYAITGRDKLRRDEPSTDAGAAWKGWGTALKPALEPITVARKPLVGTVAANVLAHGTGALNVDGCRIPGEQVTTSRNVALGSSAGSIYGAADTPADFVSHPGGRWPANLIHDGSEEVVGLFPQSKDGVAGKRTGQNGVGNWGYGAATEPWGGYGQSGSAARFFYCAKASKADRDEGLDAMPIVTADPYGQHRGRRMEDNDARFDGKPAAQGKNHHPTVKPTDLMRYLCRLVTPPNGLVLDPFSGSGSTGKAAVLEGFRFIGIEREAEYVEIARRRIAAAVPEPTLGL